LNVVALSFSDLMPLQLRPVHGLRRRTDQKEFGGRTSQFLDHFLKGAPTPTWMSQGSSYIDRDEGKERCAGVTAPGALANG
jgi:hypothetical protein